jgi:hypothetical protein
MHDDPTSDVTFYPPLYVQRYAAVRDILLRAGAIGVGSGSVVDVGCSEGGFAQFVMSPTSTLGPQHMTLIDMSTNALTEVRRKVLSDTIGAMHWFPRTADLVLGDATLSDTQFSDGHGPHDAVVAIETIEHVALQNAAAFMPQLGWALSSPTPTPGGVLAPPDRDANAGLFRMSSDRFRHRDHKFEWTGAEFTAFCQDVLDNTPGWDSALTFALNCKVSQGVVFIPLAFAGLGQRLEQCFDDFEISHCHHRRTLRPRSLSALSLVLPLVGCYRSCGRLGTDQCRSVVHELLSEPFSAEWGASVPATALLLDPCVTRAEGWDALVTELRQLPDAATTVGQLGDASKELLHALLGRLDRRSGTSKRGRDSCRERELEAQRLVGEHIDNAERQNPW